MKKISLNTQERWNAEITMKSNNDIPRIASDTEVLVRVKSCAMQSKYCQSYEKKQKTSLDGIGICGIVADTGPKATFEIGDCVVGTDKLSTEIAEYVILDSMFLQLKPNQLSDEEACVSVDIGLRALNAIESAKIEGNERVLIIGAASGVGLFLIDLLKATGIPYLAVVSSREKLMRSLDIDKVMNYTKGDYFWNDVELKSNQVDVIFDCEGNPETWAKVKGSKILKSRNIRGRYLNISLTNSNRKKRSNPITSYYQKYSDTNYEGNRRSEDLARLFKYLEQKNLKGIFELATTFPFTVDGVQEAFNLQKSQYMHGKVVINVASKSLQ